MFLWPRKNFMLHQQTNVLGKNRDFETFLENGFLTLEVFLWPGGHFSSPWPPPDHHSTRGSRFWCSLKKCFLDPADIQASKQFPLARLFFTRHRIRNRFFVPNNDIQLIFVTNIMDGGRSGSQGKQLNWKWNYTRVRRAMGPNFLGSVFPVPRVTEPGIFGLYPVSVRAQLALFKFCYRNGRDFSKTCLNARPNWENSRKPQRFSVTIAASPYVWATLLLVLFNVCKCIKNKQMWSLFKSNEP